MTPPIAPPQQHFSGDSQDSSSKRIENFFFVNGILIDLDVNSYTEGYTSISVREPLANIIAQTNQQLSHARRRELIDSHYATVSDDSGKNLTFHSETIE